MSADAWNEIERQYQRDIERLQAERAAMNLVARRLEAKIERLRAGREGLLKLIARWLDGGDPFLAQESRDALNGHGSEQLPRKMED